ncbi:MAG: hypothetical protein J5758_05820 [Abditibacteriota bacterium]|nr:hypothetical protein [Abditibacteriota bacterium]
MNLSGIQKQVVRTCGEYGLLPPGSRVVCGVSGGKDSMALVTVLASLQDRLSFELTAAVYITGSYDLIPEPLPAPTAEYLSSLGVRLTQRPITCEAEAAPLSCYRCAALRRKALLEAARDEGASVLAVAHTADDAAETALLELLSKGTWSALAPKRDYFGAVTLVRPLIGVEGKAVEAYAARRRIPLAASRCPLALTSRRAAARDLLRECRSRFPDAAENLLKAVNRYKYEE